MAFCVYGAPGPAHAIDKDQSRLPVAEDAGAGSLQAPVAQSEPAPPSEEDDSEEPNLGEIPVITTVELTVDLAHRAVDAFAVVKDKYRDANLEEFENLQDFVDQAPEGKAFDEDIKAFGFANVTDWNTAITSVGFAYSALSDDQSHEIELQIKEIEGDATIADDMKDRMISSLRAMIPSENNRKVIAEMAADPAYEEKLKLLAEEE
jgi:hypothetical protein